MVPTFSGTRILLTGSVLIAGITSPLGGQAPDYDAEIRGIGERSDVRAAFQAIDSLQDQGRADLITLTEIPAPPFMETERARAYAEMLRQAGADSVWTDDIGNVLSLRRGRSGDRTVAIDAHLDTVFPEGTDVSVRVRGDTLLAPGVGDDTQGLVLVLTVLRALEAADIQTEGDVLITATVGEEGLGDLRGVKHLFRPGGPEIDSWIAVDGGDASRVAHQAVGSYRYRITVRGPGGHSWGAFGLANPHHALARMIHHFVEAADPYTREGTKTSYNIGRIGGGTSINGRVTRWTWRSYPLVADPPGAWPRRRPWCKGLSQRRDTSEWSRCWGPARRTPTSPSRWGSRPSRSEKVAAARAPTRWMNGSFSRARRQRRGRRC